MRISFEIKNRKTILKDQNKESHKEIGIGIDTKNLDNDIF